MASKIVLEQCHKNTRGRLHKIQGMLLNLCDRPGYKHHSEKEGSFSKKYMKATIDNLSRLMSLVENDFFHEFTGYQISISSNLTNLSLEFFRNQMIEEAIIQEIKEEFQEVVEDVRDAISGVDDQIMEDFKTHGLKKVA